MLARGSGLGPDGPPGCAVERLLGVLGEEVRDLVWWDGSGEEVALAGVAAGVS